MAPKKMKGASYGRVSTLEQAFNEDRTRKDDASPQMQRIRCQNFIDNLNATDKKIHRHIIEHISDDGFSGGNTNRPGFQKMIDQIKRGEIDFVIATELSRLSRNTFDFLDFFNLCAKHSVDVIIMGLNLDTSTPMGKVIITILVALAEFERNMTGERVRQNAYARLISDGKINGAVEVLGLDRCPSKKGHYIINMEEVKVVEKIFHIFLLTLNRAETFREIEKQNIKWKRGENFTQANFDMLFKCASHRYRGIWPVYKTPDEVEQYVKLPHGQVINSELLDQVEKKLKETQTKKRQAGKNGYVYLLSTLLEHEDGTTYSGQPAKERQYRYYYNKSNDMRLRCDEIEEKIFERLEEYLMNDEQLKKLLNQTSVANDNRSREIKIQIAEVNRDLLLLDQRENVIKEKILMTSDLSGSAIFEMLEKEITEIKEKRSLLDSTLKELQDHQNQVLAPISANAFKKTVKSFLGEMKKTPNATHRGMLEKIFTRIVVKSNNEIELQIPEGIFRENKTSRSSSAGLNGGSTGT